MACAKLASGVLLSSLLVGGCETERPPIIVTPQLAMGIAAEQCGNEFHLGQPTNAHSSGDDWIVSWPSSSGHSGLTVTIDGELGVPTQCGPTSSSATS